MPLWLTQLTVQKSVARNAEKQFQIWFSSRCIRIEKGSETLVPLNKAGKWVNFIVTNEEPNNKTPNYTVYIKRCSLISVVGTYVVTIKIVHDWSTSVLYQIGVLPTVPPPRVS